MGVSTSKTRLYDLAKELKIDTKRLIEEVRREGVDVSVPSNSISKELAEKIREKYFPKKDIAVKRAIRVVTRRWTAASRSRSPSKRSLQRCVPSRVSISRTVMARRRASPCISPATA